MRVKPYGFTLIFYKTLASRLLSETRKISNFATTYKNH